MNHRTVRAGALSALALAIVAAPQVASTQSKAAVSGVERIRDAIAAFGNALLGTKLFVAPSSPAKTQADAWRRSRPADAALMDRIAAQPTGNWLGAWNHDVRGDVARLTSAAASAGTVPLLVAYNIPDRDCGSYSAGGANGGDAYRKWIADVAAGIGGRRAVVVLEPDAVAQSSCLSAPARQARFDLLSNAVSVLKQAGAVVYLDAGNANWVAPDEMAQRLRAAGIAQADGFSLNVSNYISTAANIAYGDKLSSRIGGKHYVIDTSRNGVASANGQWCNPAGQGVGAEPTTRTGHERVDAFLWVKQPGESDGTCNGGPRAGQWWSDGALALARNAND